MLGTFKSNFPPFWEIMTDRPTDQPAEGHEDHREVVTLPIKTTLL